MHSMLSFLTFWRVAAAYSRAAFNPVPTSCWWLCRQRSPEAHPFPDERAGSIYVQAQWQDGGVIHDVRPHGQGISLSSIGQAEALAEKDVVSA